MKDAFFISCDGGCDNGAVVYEDPERGEMNVTCSTCDGQGKVRACRVCHCTENNACVDDDETPCHWIAFDRCSACVSVAA